jgi:hypothetical protein
MNANFRELLRYISVHSRNSRVCCPAGKKNTFSPFFLPIYLTYENVCVILLIVVVLFDRKQKIPKDSGAEILLRRIL